MTNEQFYKAENIKKRILKVNELIEYFSKHTYDLKPPTRSTSYTICYERQKEIELQEGDVVVILNAFKKEKSKLEDEFNLL